MKLLLPLVLSFLPLSVSALNLTYPELPGGFKLEDATSLPALVAWLYVFFVMISGLAAFAMIIWGGVKWMTSQGDPASTGDAKDKIKMALLGLLLVLTSFLILQIINPELTKLNIPGLNPILPEEPNPELTLSADDTLVLSGSNVVLTWSGTGFTNCDASSSPIFQVWSGPKQAAGQETVGPITKITTFQMYCASENTEVLDTATVVVGIDTGAGPGPTPTVSLIVAASSLDPGVLPDSPEFYYNSDDLGDFNNAPPLTITWTSTTAERCIAKDRLFDYVSGEMPPNDYEVTINSNPFLGLNVGDTYTFALECFASDGQSATDSFKITRNAF